MVATLVHEKFYVSGTWSDESLGVYVGWVARQGSFSDGMPLRNEQGDVTLVFSGEEYPEPGTKQRLQQKGHQLDKTPASYLVHLYEEDPTAFPAVLNGRFHGVAADRRTRSAMLFNDRFGMHRLYYHESESGLYFAAEAKAILAVRPEQKTLNSQSLGEFVSCGAVLRNQTLFQGIQLLPPGSAWVVENGTVVRKGLYFDPREWEQQETLDEESYYRQLRETFSGNVNRYFNGAQPVAMSLTGGLDTRIIMAWRKAQPESLPCYTFGGMLRECQDVIVARKIAEACGQPHQVIRLGQDWISRFPHYAERTVYLTDGCVDVSRTPDLHLNERAREIAPVRLTGNYGGEVLRQVRSFKPVDPLPGLYRPEMVPLVEQAKRTYADVVNGHPVSFAVFKQGPWHHYGVLALEQTQLSMRSPYLDNDFLRAVYRAPGSTYSASDVSVRLIADGDGSLLRIPTDRGLAGNRGRWAAAASRGILEFQFKAEYAYDMGMPQWVASLDHLVSPMQLDRLFLGRHKIFHFRVWYRDALAGYVREMLLDRRSLSRNFVDRKAVETIVRGHLGGYRNYTNQIHQLLTLEIFHRLFLDK